MHPGVGAEGDLAEGEVAMDWNTFVTTLTATGFASAAFVFLAKILSKHLLSMDLESFKADLRAKNEKELEQLKAELRIAAFQQETTFARLHEKRAEVIAELYAKLAEVHDRMQLLLFPSGLNDGEDLRQHREKEASNAAIDFAYYYNTHKIFFEEPLCDLLESFNRDILISWGMHKDGSTASKGEMGSTEREAAWQHLDKQVKPIRNEIEATFRKLIGLTPLGTTPSKAG